MKIGVFIIPHEKISSLIKEWKSSVLTELGYQTYCTHPPHLTLFTLDIQDHLASDALKSLGTIVSKFLIENIRIVRPACFSSDPMTKKTSLIYEVEKSFGMAKLQESLILALQEFRDVNNISLDGSFSTEQLRNHRNLGYPFLKNNWLPHLTIASIEANLDGLSFINRFKEQELNLEEQPKYVAAYKICGDEHIELGTFDYAR